MEIDRLAKIDQQVRTHEAAHLAASGGLAQGGANFTYTQGPDGKRYAVGGEVSISIPADRTPEDTLQIAQTVIRAALAPADPSAQDRAVAAYATAMATTARAEIAAQSGASTSNEGGGRSGRTDPRVAAYTQATNASSLIDVVA